LNYIHVDVALFTYFHRSDIGEVRSAKRGAVSINILEEMNGLGGLKDAEYRDLMEGQVVGAYKDLCAWHQQQQQQL